MQQLVDLRLGTQFAEDLAMVVTQAHPGENFSDIYAKADQGMASYDRLRNKLLRAARERAESYPLPVRLRLGSPTTRGERRPVRAETHASVLLFASAIVTNVARVSWKRMRRRAAECSKSCGWSIPAVSRWAR